MSERKILELDGRHMTSFDDFWDEIHRILCPNFKHFGRNWDALVDILRGGFGVFELGEEITLVIAHSKTARKKFVGSFDKFISIISDSNNIYLVLK